MGNAMYIPSNTLSYQAYSTDIVDGKVASASYKGASLYMIDEQKWYRILDDLTLAPLVYNISSGTSGSIGGIFISGSIALGASTANIGVVTSGSSENHVGEFGGRMTSGSVEFTNTSGSNTAYSIGDTVSGGSLITIPYEIPNIFRVNGGSGYIVSIGISTNKSGITPAFRVHFYSGSSVTLSGDNLPYLDSYADTAYKLRPFDLISMSSSVNTSGSCSRTWDTTTIRQAVTAQSNSKSLWVALETLSIFTPNAVSEKYNISVIMDNN